jgi:hypothetical protein
VWFARPQQSQQRVIKALRAFNIHHTKHDMTKNAGFPLPDCVDEIVALI